MNTLPTLPQCSAVIDPDALPESYDDLLATARALRDAIAFTLTALQNHHMSRPGIPTLCERAEGIANRGSKVEA